MKFESDVTFPSGKIVKIRDMVGKRSGKALLREEGKSSAVSFCIMTSRES